VQNHIAAGNGLEFFVWLGLIFLKIHLKDRDFRVVRDLREPDDKIGDVYDWQALHHMHCLVRCVINGAHLEKEVFGSLAADYGDVFSAQTMLLRLGDVTLITTFNDACGAINGAMPILERIEGPLSEVQAREIMVDFAFVNLSLKERPKFYTDCDTRNETLTEKALMPEQFELGELNFGLRGQLLRLAFGERLGQLQFVGKTAREIEQAIDTGRLTFLFDDHGKFIKCSFASQPPATE
jgi:hypothetical protein